jgi:hypothetical protein
VKPPHLYFPVKPAPLRMEPGLRRLATNEPFFPRDDTSPRYLAGKQQVLAAHPERNGSLIHGEEEQRIVDAAALWLSTTLRAEGHEAAARLPLVDLGAALVEDFVIMSGGAGPDRAIWINVCFPSGWCPEDILGKSFVEIHQPVPSFTAINRNSAALVESVSAKGPYERFVWTISADDELDHHPKHGRSGSWSAPDVRGYLRVERQVTAPLPGGAGFIFLIRIYLYAFDELAADSRTTLATALEVMPEEFVRYKRIEAAIPIALRLLRTG